MILKISRHASIWTARAKEREGGRRGRNFKACKGEDIGNGILAGLTKMKSE